MNSSATLSAGVWGVVATPYHGATLDVDHVSLNKLVSHYQSIGVTGLTVLGVFGEAAQLTNYERQAVLRTVAEATSLPIVAGVTALGTAEAIEEVRRAQATIGDRLEAAMIQINSTDTQALVDHLSTVHDETGAAAVVQDYPLISGVHISTEKLTEAIQGLNFIAALKAEAPPTPPAIAALIGAGTSVPIFGGLGGLGLLDELEAGAAGAMTGFSFPEGLLACVRAHQTGGYAAARAAYLPYLPLVNFEQQSGIALGIRKACLVERGLIAESGVRAPAVAIPGSMVSIMRSHVANTPLGS